MGYLLVGFFIGVAVGYFTAALMFVASRDSRAREVFDDAERVSVSAQEDEV